MGMNLPRFAVSMNMNGFTLLRTRSL